MKQHRAPGFERAKTRRGCAPGTRVDLSPACGTGSPAAGMGSALWKPGPGVALAACAEPASSGLGAATRRRSGLGGKLFRLKVLVEPVLLEADGRKEKAPFSRKTTINSALFF